MPTVLNPTSNVPEGHPNSSHSRFSGRAMVFAGASFVFVMMALSGAMLFVAPTGGIAWQILGMGRDGWYGLFIASTVVFATFVLWHTLLHQQIDNSHATRTPTYWSVQRREAFLALALMLAIGIAAVQT